MVVVLVEETVGEEKSANQPINQFFRRIRCFFGRVENQKGIRIGDFVSICNGME